MSDMKILIVKIGAIGDVIMALPMAREMRARWPEAHVTWICGRQVKQVIEACGVADRLIVVNEDRLAFEVLRVWRELGLQRFDLVVRAHRDVRYGALCHMRGRRWIPQAGVYHGLEYLRLIGGGALKWPHISLPEVEYEGDIVLAPGGQADEIPGRGLRIWSIERYAELAKRVSGHVVIVGGPRDRWISNHFEGVVDCVGRLSLLETMAVMSRAKVVIAHDSGPMHMAILSGARTIGLFGPTSPHNFLPPDVERVWGGERLSCRPCYDGKYFANCRDPKCMQSISVNQVLEMI